ncbi:MAG: hypothetical protein K2N51_06965 [Lachnospiraceae bacterium]|nr:hypothetical protein [Lachnospiraceae bacterium]
MDLRTKRTKHSIINAFIQLRSQKPLEKITIKELSEIYDQYPEFQNQLE